MTKRKILYLCSWYPSRINKLNGWFIKKHAELAASNYEVTILAFVPDDSLSKRSEIVWEKVEGVNTCIVYYSRLSTRFLNFIKKLRLFFKLKSLIKDQDLIHLNTIFPMGIYALFAKLFWDKKYIWTEHWTIFETTDLFFNYWKKNLIKIVGNHSSKVLPVSQSLGLDIQKFGINTPQYVIHNVIDCELFSPSEKLVPNKPLRFLHISNLNNEQKNITGILNAFALVKDKGYDYILEIGGNGDLEELNTRIAERNLQDNTMVFGSIPHEKVAEKMKKADVYVSFSNFETQGCTILEALASGTYVISSDLPSIREYLTEDFGSFVPKKNEKELAKKIIELIQHPKPKNLAASAMVADNYSPKIITEKLNEVYRQFL